MRKRFVSLARGIVEGENRNDGESEEEGVARGRGGKGRGEGGYVIHQTIYSGVSRMYSRFRHTPGVQRG